MTKVSIITPSIGRDTLLRLCQSIDNQTVKSTVEIEHIIVTDGSQYHDAVLTWTEPYKQSKKYLVLPDTLGTWGGPARAAGTMIATGDYICFIDDDNWIEPSHLEKLLQIVLTWELTWVAAKRFVHTVDGAVLDKDPEYMSHIDGNCFLAKADVVKKYAHLYARFGFVQDRDFIAHLKQEFPLVIYPIDTTVHYYTKWTKEYGEEFIKQREQK